MNHTHACHQCGDVWQHDEPANDAWHAAHTCRNGHLCSVKYDPKTAAGIAETCKAGGDAKAYIAKADPLAALTLELEGDHELSEAVWTVADRGDFGYHLLSRDMRKRVDAFQARYEAARCNV